MKKLLSLILTIAILLTVAVCVPIFQASGADWGSDAGNDTGASGRTIYFDTNNTGWNNFSRISVYCYDPEYGETLTDWASFKKAGMTDEGNGIWSFDFDAKGIEIQDGRQYSLIFNTDIGQQTHDLLFDTSCCGDTAFCTGEMVENPADSNKTANVARWKSGRLGPMKCITSIGNVVGEVVPAYTTPYRMFVDFLAGYGNSSLMNARIYSSKTDQKIIDNTASSLGLSINDTERAVFESGIETEWQPGGSSIGFIEPEKCFIYLDTSAISGALNGCRKLYCYYSGYNLARRISDDRWILDLEHDYSDPIDGSYSTSGSSGYNGYRIKPAIKTLEIYGNFDKNEFCSATIRIDETCYGDTLVFTGESAEYEDNYGKMISKYLVRWSNHNNAEYGSHTFMDKGGKLHGDVVPDFSERCALLRYYVNRVMPSLLDNSIETEQYLIDDMASMLGMKKADVACMIESGSYWKPDDSFLPEGYSYDKGTLYLLDSNETAPCGYSYFEYDADTGFYIAQPNYNKPKAIYYGGSSGSSSSSGGSDRIAEHTFTPDASTDVVRYDGGTKFTRVSKESLIMHSKTICFFRPDDGNFCFGYNTYKEMYSKDSSGWGMSSGGSQKYPLRTPYISSVTDSAEGLVAVWGAVSGAEKYRVFVKGDTKWKKIGDTSATSFTFTEAESGRAYSFTVRCVSADGKSFMSDYCDSTPGSAGRHLDTPVVTKLDSLPEGVGITWNPVDGNARYRVSVKSRNSWKVLGDTYSTSFIHSSDGEGSIFAHAGTEYTYTVACVSFNGDTVTSAQNQNGWSIVYQGAEVKPTDPPTEPPSEPALEYLRGDYDGDEDITIMDATRAQNILADLIPRPSTEFLIGVDADGDKELTIMDATRIQNVLAELLSMDGRRLY